MELNQSVDWLSAQMVGNGNLDAVTLMWSPSAKGDCDRYKQGVMTGLRLTLQFNTATAIEGRPCSATGVKRHTDPEFHAIR